MGAKNDSQHLQAKTKNKKKLDIVFIQKKTTMIFKMIHPLRNYFLLLTTNMTFTYKNLM